MLQRINWFCILCIYLLVNGQIYAAPIHTCEKMLMTNNQAIFQLQNSNIDETRNTLAAMKTANHKTQPCHCLNCLCRDHSTCDFNLFISLPNIFVLNKYVCQTQIGFTRALYQFKYTERIYKPNITA